MREAPGGAPAQGATSASLRSNFAWTFAGNSFYAAGQWVILSLFAKLGGSEMLGQYALAVALTAPVVMLSHLNLRAVLATDVGGQYPFGDYLAVRLGTTAAALVAIAGIAAATGGSWPLAGAVVAVGVAQCAETASDIYHGAMQRRERMGQIARSIIARTSVSVAALGAALWMTHNLVWAVAALAVGRLAVLLAYDRHAGAAGENLSRSGLRAELAIFRTALPLGVVLMLVSLNANLPRYAVEHHLGTRDLGVFAAVVSFITVGSTIVNALGQTSTPRLARYFSECNLPRFRQLIFRLAGLVLLLGASGVLVAMFLGKFVLRLIYRPEYGAHSGLLVAVMGAATLSYLAIALGYAVTGARVFRAQMPLFCAVAACCGVASWLLVPKLGLYGAVLALALASSLQIAGQLLILVWAIRRMETAK
jgi:O-antigen/teichoic acid export membrane protein